ncbi:M6 family metalloprotease domain-containing protein [Listeria booriae]|uniref:M6 family metalloprotease domain-containing protein n=1 Tax=Listeria booriae TaxID=1552123 RepID=UPI00162627B9|nr:M6 family metalloprotease domain-containing protein [Listeria booriae]MBC2676306.1 M6 family metalloprotease domain-containing protein [Listeria booriae]
MKKICLSIIFLGGIIGFSSQVDAGVAFDAYQTVEQTSGETFKVKQVGDEYLHYNVTDTEDVVVQNSDKNWYYASIKQEGNNGSMQTSIVPTTAVYQHDKKPVHAVTEQQLKRNPQIQQQANEAENRANAERNQQPLVDAQKSGSHNKVTATKTIPTLVVLISYTDNKIQTTDASWKELFFGSSSKSVNDYYLEAALGTVNFVPATESSGVANDGVVRITLPQNHPDSSHTNQHVRIDTTIRDALAPFIDLTSYDTNKDKRINTKELNIVLLHAGQEGSYQSSQTASVWATHTGTSQPPFQPINYEFEYSELGEMHGTHQATIGQICHEIAHGLGLRDLYTNSAEVGLGFYSVMANGAWGYKGNEYSGTSPVHFDAYSAAKLGIVPVTNVISANKLSYTIKDWGTGTPSILRVNTQDPQEYYLVENRQKKGYDTGMIRASQGGIAIYRINERFSDNLDAGKQVATLMPASNDTLNLIDALYYKGTNPNGKPQNAIFNKSSIPAATLNDGTATDVDIQVKSANGPEMLIGLSAVSPQRESTIYVSGNLYHSSELPTLTAELYRIDGTKIEESPVYKGHTTVFNKLSEGIYYVHITLPTGYKWTAFNNRGQSSGGETQYGETLFGQDGNSSYVSLDGLSSKDLSFQLEKNNNTINGEVSHFGGNKETNTLTLYNASTSEEVSHILVNSKSFFRFDNVANGTYYIKASIPIDTEIGIPSKHFGRDGFTEYLTVTGNTTINDLYLQYNGTP